MIQYPQTFEQLAKLITDAIPSYDHIDRNWEDAEGEGTPVCTVCATLDQFNISPANVEAAVAAVMAVTDSDGPHGQSIAHRRYWDECKSKGVVPDAVTLGSMWGWATGHPRRQPGDRWYIGGIYGDWLTVPDFEFLWVIAAFCDTPARILFNSGKDYEPTRPAFALGIQDGRLYFQDENEATVSYD